MLQLGNMLQVLDKIESAKFILVQQREANLRLYIPYHS